MQHEPVRQTPWASDGIRIASLQGPVLAGVGPTHGRSRAVVSDSATGDHHLVWVPAGQVDVATGGELLVARPPLTLWIPSGTEYAVVSDGSAWCAAFEAESCPEAWRRRTAMQIDGVVPALLGHVARDPSGPWVREQVSIVVRHLQEALISGLAILPLPLDDRARRVADLIMRDPADDRGVRALGATVGASERTLQDTFRTETGLSVGKWRARVRMHHAARLLASGGLTVGAVASRCGYRSGEALTKAFRSHFGVAPSEFGGLASTATSPTGLDSPEWTGISLVSTDAGRGASLPSQRNPRYQPITKESTMATKPVRSAAIAVTAGLIAVSCGDDNDETITDETTSEEVPETAGVDVDDGSASASASEPAEDGSASSASASASEPADEDVDGSNLAGFAPFADPIPVWEVIEEREDTLLIRHQGGETEIPRNPQRVVTDDTLLETFLSLGITPVASQSRFSDGVTPAPAVEPLIEGLTLFGRGESNFEAIAALEPDLIIGAEWAAFADDPDATYELLSEIAPTIIPLDDPAVYWEEAADVVAETFGRADELEELKAAYATDVEAQCDRIRSVIGPDDTVSHVEMYGGGFTFLVAPGFTLDDRYLPITSTSFAFLTCGLNPGPENLDLAPTDNVEISLERLGDIQADHMFLTVYPGAEETFDEFGSNALWDQIPSVANDSVYEAPALVWWSYLSFPWALELRADAVVGA